MKTRDRYFREPASSFFVFGPRGTGKSTWLKQRFPNALWFDLLDPELQRRLMARPERLSERLAAQPDHRTVVIDEVQKAPGVLPIIHRYIEQKQGYRFVLTGSSARKLKHSGMDLLAGRAVLSPAHPFMAAEIGDAFDLETALRMGMVPLILDAPEPEKTLAAYSTLYLREEVAAEGLVRNIGDFARFLEAISFSHASLLNCSEVSRECEVSRKTVEGYVSVLEDLLLGSRLPVFSRRAKRHLIKQSKFYYFDAGVFRSIRPQGPLDQTSEIEGATLEGLVCQHLRAWVDYSEGRHDLFFWRTKSGVEVDFVVYGDSHFCALEVKNRSRLDRKDVKALKAFRQDYPEATALLLYRGKDRLRIDGILCMPCEEFLCGLAPGSGLEE